MDLESQLAALQREAEDQITYLEVKNTEATERLQEKEALIRKQLKQIQLLETAAGDSEKATVKLQDDLGRLKKQLAVARKSPKADPVVIDKYNAQIDELVDKNQRLQDMYKKQIDLCNTDRSQFENDMANMEAIIHGLEDKLEQESNAKKELDAEIRDLQLANLYYETEIEQCTTAKESLDSLKEIVDKLQSTIAVQVSDIDQLQRANRSLKQAESKLLEENEQAKLNLKKFQDYAALGLVGTFATGVGVGKAV